MAVDMEAALPSSAARMRDGAQNTQNFSIVNQSKYWMPFYEDSLNQARLIKGQINRVPINPG
jgi:hypothetical protein